MTAPGANAAEFNKLPKDLAALCEVIQGVVIHRDMAPFLYNLNLSKEQRDEEKSEPPSARRNSKSEAHDKAAEIKWVARVGVGTGRCERVVFSQVAGAPGAYHKSKERNWCTDGQRDWTRSCKQNK